MKKYALRRFKIAGLQEYDASNRHNAETCTACD